MTASVMFWIKDDFKRIKDLRTVDELLMATQDLMLSPRVSEKQLDFGLAAVKERLRELTVSR